MKKVGNILSDNIYLELRNITKTFPGVKALDNVSFDLRKGEVHALCGENGAGKSTLIHVLGGVYAPNAGQIIINGEEVKFESPLYAARCGVAVVYQELSLVSNLSVAENIFANRQPIGKLGMINRKKLYADTKEALKLFGLENDIDPSVRVGDLSVANQQVIEILKSMTNNPKILVFDEPTSSLTSVEKDELFTNIKKLKGMGISCIYISHHLNEIFEIADRVTVLRDGKHVTTQNVKDVDEDKLITYMVGREISNIYGRREADEKIGDVYFEVKNLSLKGKFKDISFSLRRGEILGISGLVGAGRTEMGMSIFGVMPPDSGEVWLEGKKQKLSSPFDAIENKIAYLTEDRKVQGLFLNMSVRDNYIAPDTFKYAKNGLRFINNKDADNAAEEAVQKLKIATPSIMQKVNNLSGGNQQKVLLSMWMGINPKVLIVDEPTRGVDVGAKNDIYRLLRNMAKQGIGIIVISSDLMEVLGISDRILVMKEGQIVGEVNCDEATEEKVVSMAAGVGTAL